LRLAAGSSEFQAIYHPFIVMRKIVLFIHPSFLFTNTKVALRALIDDGQDTMSQNDDGFLVSQLAKLCKTATLQIFLAARSLARLLTSQTTKQTKAWLLLHENFFIFFQ
jgi:hypothetical protein